MSAVCPEGDPLKGNLVRSHWWPLALCVCLFVCLSKPILLAAPRCGEGRGLLLQNFHRKRNFKGLIFKKARNPRWEYTNESHK